MTDSSSRRSARRARRFTSAATVLACLAVLSSACSDSDATAEVRESVAPASAPTTGDTTVADTTTTAPPTTTTTTTTTVTTVAAGYSFPISPASAASYARTHHTYPAVDIFAACGLDVVAPHAGVVQELTMVDTWSASENTPETRGGLSFSVVGDDGVRYYGSHLGELDPAIVVGERVSTGQRIGSVGETGNAAGTGCHLHFGISTPCGPGDVLRRRGEFWPQAYLDGWALGEPLSPAELIDPSTC